MTDFKKIFEEKGIDYIQFQFTTIFGDFKMVEFPSSIWDEMKEGTGVDGSSLGFLTTEQSDMRAIPDLSTFNVLPWDNRTARFICDFYDNEGKPHPACPRGILKRIIAEAKELGLDYKTRPELEWFFVDSDIEPIENALYMDTLPFDTYAHVRRAISDDMLDMGIGVKTIHHECGISQHEIEFTVDDALRHADNVQTTKLISKAQASFEGIFCTYMAKPFHDQAGSGLHVHQYITKDGVNIFSDAEKGLSDELHWFVGGILKYTNEMTAFLNPTTNSYKRLVPGHEAPVYVSWGVGNRTALIRVPGYEKNARIEYRAADCATNIYLASALLLAAGLEGMKNKIEPIKPTTKNIENLSEEERKEMGITQLPEDLGNALDLLEKSDFVKKCIGDELLQIFLNTKRKEFNEYLKAKELGLEEELEWEYEMYLERS